MCQALLEAPYKVQEGKIYILFTTNSSAPRLCLIHSSRCSINYLLTDYMSEWIALFILTTTLWADTSILLILVEKYLQGEKCLDEIAQLEHGRA